MSGTLLLIATPIGNLEDLSPRAARALAEVDALACEDTRVTRKIFERFAIAAPRTLFAYHEHNEHQACARILGLLEQGLRVGVCTDGGMPGISDPGYRAVRAALDAGHAIDVVPGPSAVTTALLLAGLPMASFTFKGFPPRKSAARRRFLEMERHLPHAIVLYESPFRIGALLDDALAALGDREAAVCFELTKLHQRAARGRLSELATQFRGQTPKGEITVVIAGLQRKDRLAQGGPDAAVEEHGGEDDGDEEAPGG